VHGATSSHRTSHTTQASSSDPAIGGVPAPGKQVAIIGLGGLGHTGVKIAHALGTEVTVLSQSLRKKDDGLKLGADHYYATSDPKRSKSWRATST
jgi:D-arabinose 1-dehydrogenase-like Zn-dependent alcohol dehydrogenase